MIPLSIDILAYITAGLIIVLIVFIVLLIKTNKRISKLLYGKKSENLEDSLHQLLDGIEEIAKRQHNSDKAIKEIREELERAVSGVGVVRFNPFEGSSGSNQSFAIALIDKNGDGVVISSLYSRERVSVYAKPVKKFESEFTFTEEESRALGKARGL
jgi:hypothetical protein